MKKTLFLLIALAMIEESCRTTRIVIAPDVPEGVLGPSSIDPIAGKAHQTEPTIAQFEKPGKGDSIYAEYPIHLVRRNAFHLNGLAYSTYRAGDTTLAMPEVDFYMEDGVVHDWTGWPQGALRIEFECACFIDGKLRFFKRDSLSKDPNFPAKLLLRDPEIEWKKRADRTSSTEVPTILDHDIDGVDPADSSKYLLVPILKKGMVCDMFWLGRKPYDGDVQEICYELSAEDSKHFRIEDGSRTVYGKKIDYFIVIKLLDPGIAGLIKLRHRKMARF